ncbi:mechanosensitive ion channel family protein [Patescibacteria group bacterium]|nr:mechanosensitive ion channel family protein [Patescibacteria group bacterium]
MFDNLFTNIFWSKTLLENSYKDFLMAAILLLVLIIIFKVFQSIAIYRLGKLAGETKTDIDDTAIEIFKTIKPPFFIFFAFYLAFRTLTFPDAAVKVISSLLIAWVIFLSIKAVQILIDYLFKSKFHDEGNAGTQSAVKAVSLISKIILWSIGFILILSNLGINVTSLVAGLGVGGIAIALAMQNILSDLFSSFAIYFDKPFSVGDFIVVGDKKGTVEKIGIKTTRLKALQGEELVISNQELTNAQIQNFKKMNERRINFSIGLTYDTSTEKLKKVPEMIKKIIESTEGARFDRVHFKEFGDFSLNFEIVYFIKSSDFQKYMNVQQSINFEIKSIFEKEGITMAFPTQTIEIAK